MACRSRGASPLQSRAASRCRRPMGAGRHARSPRRTHRAYRAAPPWARAHRTAVHANIGLLGRTTHWSARRPRVYIGWSV